MFPRMYLHKLEFSLSLGNDKLMIDSICISRLGVLRWMNEPLFRLGSGGAERSRTETGCSVLNRRVSRICFQPCLFVRMIHAERFRVSLCNNSNFPSSVASGQTRPSSAACFHRSGLKKPLRCRASSFGSLDTPELLVMASLGKRALALRQHRGGGNGGLFLSIKGTLSLLQQPVLIYEMKGSPV